MCVYLNPPVRCVSGQTDTLNVQNRTEKKFSIIIYFRCDVTILFPLNLQLISTFKWKMAAEPQRGRLHCDVIRLNNTRGRRLPEGFVFEPGTADRRRNGERERRLQ